MNGLLILPYELQIVLVSGYLGYKVTMIGRSGNPRTEDLLLQVLTFGLLGRVGLLGVVTALKSVFPTLESSISPEVPNLLFTGVGAVLVSLIIASLWRKFGLNLASGLMSRFGIYRDDHQHSTWDSIIQDKKVAWTFIQVHVDDGRILESKFELVPEKVSVAKITLNDDGIALYVTASYDTAMKRKKHPACDESFGHILTYVPRNTIKQLEIGLKPR